MKQVYHTRTTFINKKLKKLDFFFWKTNNYIKSWIFYKTLGGLKSKPWELHSAFEDHLRGSMFLNFHVLVGFYMLVRGFPEDIGPPLPQILAQWSRLTTLFISDKTQFFKFSLKCDPKWSNHILLESICLLGPTERKVHVSYNI